MREILVDNEHWYNYVFTAKTYLALAIAIIPAGALLLIRYFDPDRPEAPKKIAASQEISTPSRNTRSKTQKSQ